MTAVPILLYHSVSGDGSPFTITATIFRRQLDAVVEAGLRSLTVSAFVDAMRGAAPLPERPVVITFDDGFADFSDIALPELRKRGLVATLYVTTGLLRGSSRPVAQRDLADRRLAWSQLGEVAAQGVEIGGHSHTHPQLDTLSRSKAADEITRCKALLEDALETRTLSFAYPNGYSSPSVRRLVRDAGYESACSVKNALSSTLDDRFSLARLTVLASTSPSAFRAWISGAGAPVAPSRELVRTRIWRVHRRVRAVATRRPGSDVR